MMDKIAERFAELADKFGPQVVQTALEAARVEAYSQLASAGIWGLVGASWLAAARWAWKKDAKAAARDNLYSGEWIAVGLFALAAAGLCLVIALWTLVDPWTWTAISRPELWIAKKVFKL